MKISAKKQGVGMVVGVLIALLVMYVLQPLNTGAVILVVVVSVVIGEVLIGLAARIWPPQKEKESE